MGVTPFTLSAIMSAVQLTISETMASSGFLGANLRGTPYWCGAMMYVDVIRNCGSFAKTSQPYALPGVNPQSDFALVKADGWPAESFSCRFLSSLLSYPYQTGTYEGSFTGTADNVVAANGATLANLRVEGSKTRFQLIVDGSMTAPVVSVVNPSANFSDFRVIRPGYAWDTTQLLTNEYIATAGQSGYSTLRMMDHQNTSTTPTTYDVVSSSKQTSWANRFTGTSTYLGQVARQYSLEEQIDVANALGKNLWLCIPHAADDSYLTGMMQLVDSTLAAGKHAYIELSNETWNPAPGYVAQLQHIQLQSNLELGFMGGSNFNSDFQSVVISGGGTLATITMKVNHNITDQQQIKFKAGSGNTSVPTNIYTATVVSPTVFTVPVSGRTDGTATLTTTNCMLLRNATSALAYDWVAGSNANGYWPQKQDQYSYGYRWAARRLARFMEIANSTLAPGWQNRLRLVYAGQYASAGSALDALNFLDCNYGNLKSWLYGLSAAVYVSAKSTDSTAGAILTSMEADNITKKNLYWRWVNAAKYFGIKFTQYEIGTDMAVSPASAAEKLAADNDPRMKAITKTMLQNAMDSGCDSAMWYIEGVLAGGGNFDFRRTPFETPANNQRIAAQSEALALPVPTDYPQYRGAIVGTSGYEDSALVLSVGPAGKARAYGNGCALWDKNQVTAAVPAEFAVITYAHESRDYSIVTKLAGSYSTPTVKVMVDDVDTGARIACPSINPYTTSPTEQPAVTVPLAKGWHVIKFITTTNATASLACGGVTIT